MTLDLATLPEVPQTWDWILGKGYWLTADAERVDGKHVHITCSSCNRTEAVWKCDDGSLLAVWPHCPNCHGRHRACGSCGECIDDWTPTLTRRSCSNACRQKAYRARKAVDR